MRDGWLACYTQYIIILYYIILLSEENSVEVLRRIKKNYWNNIYISREDKK